MAAVITRVALAAVLALSLQGCLTTKGPDPVLSRRGPQQQGDVAGLANRFKTHETAARTAIGGSGESNASRSMMRSGVALVRASCDDYFREAGHTQRGVNVGRQLIATTSAIASTVLLGEDGNENIVQYLGIATSGSYAVIDTYTENFLFSAANISSVRTLVMSALDVHRAAISEADVNYEIASQMIMDHQAICMPQNIADLVRQAITAGRVVAVPNTSRTALENSTDLASLRSLRSALGGIGALSNDEAGALWWLINGEVTTATLNGPIKSALGALPDGPFLNGVYRTNWPMRARVETLLDSLSAGRKAAYASRADELAEIARAAGNAPAVAATFPMTAPGETPTIAVIVDNSASRNE